MDQNKPDAKADEKKDAKAKLTPEEEAVKAQAEEHEKAVAEREKVLADEDATDEEKRAAVLNARLSPDIGMDGVNPITPNNPPRGSQPETSRPHD